MIVPRAPMRSKMKTILPVPVPKPPPRKSNPEGRGLLGLPTRPSFHPTHPSIHPTSPEIRLTQPSIPVSAADIEEVLPATISPQAIARSANAVNDVTPLHARSALTTQEAKVIVQENDREFRARVEAEVTLLVRQALAALSPPPAKTDHGASVRWLLVGLVFGALFVYVMMAGALREKEVALAQARVAVPTVVSQPSALAPAMIVNSPPLMCSATGESLVSTIPTVDVDDLPKIDPPKARRYTAPRKALPKKNASNLDEENPYNAAADNPYEGVSPAE